MNNTIGQRGIATLKFIELLKESVSCRVIPWDERLSTVSAINILSETDIRGKKEKQLWMPLRPKLSCKVIWIIKTVNLLQIMRRKYNER